MASAKLQEQTSISERRRFPLPVIGLWGFVAVAAISLIWIENDLGHSFPGFYLLPWCLIAGICVLAPSAYMFVRGRFDFFNPLTFAAWSYVFPAFVGGGLIIAFGAVNPYFMTFIDDPEYNLPLSLVYVAVGFLGLWLGYSLPVGRYIAEKVERRLPDWKWSSSDMWLPGTVLLLAGIAVNLIGFVQGIMGFQRITEIGVFDSALFFLLTMVGIGYIALWFGIFTAERRTGTFYLVLAAVIAFIPIRLALLASRAGLFISIVPIAMAFGYSGRRLRPRMALLFGSMVVLAVFFGAVYGTAFRNIKGSEAKVNAGDYIGLVADTVDYLTTQNTVSLVGDSLQALADRIDNLSSLAVVVANYEKLAPYEASYGLQNNIINDAMTSLVPRFVWADKPGTSDARAYSDLYFNYGENSFAITPFGDLLRNFGPIGVPLGMIVLGVYLRLIYRLLIETPFPAIWKKVAYFPLLTAISYEGFYATILPGVIRTIFVVVLSLLVCRFLIRSRPRA